MHLYVCAYTCTRVYMYVCYIAICVYLSMFTLKDTHTHARTHTHTHTHTHRSQHMNEEALEEFLNVMHHVDRIFHHTQR
jgi:hypothetical protein